MTLTEGLESLCQGPGRSQHSREAFFAALRGPFWSMSPIPGEYLPTVMVVDCIRVDSHKLLVLSSLEAPSNTSLTDLAQLL